MIYYKKEGEDMKDDFVERLLKKEKPLREFFHTNCKKCDEKVIAKYTLGEYYYSCECGHLDKV